MQLDESGRLHVDTLSVLTGQLGMLRIDHTGLGEQYPALYYWNDD